MPQWEFIKNKFLFYFIKKKRNLNLDFAFFYEVTFIKSLKN